MQMSQAKQPLTPPWIRGKDADSNLGRAARRWEGDVCDLAVMAQVAHTLFNDMTEHRGPGAVEAYTVVTFTDDDFNALVWAVAEVAARARDLRDRYYREWEAARHGPVVDPDDESAK